VPICIKWFSFNLVSIIVEGRRLHDAWVAAAAEEVRECLMNFVVGESLASAEVWAFSGSLLGGLSFRTHYGDV